MNLTYFLLSSVLFSTLGVMIGAFILLKPARTIELQTRFYEKINWRMVPISMRKEIRNTRIMASVLIGVSLIGIGCLVALPVWPPHLRFF